MDNEQRKQELEKKLQTGRDREAVLRELAKLGGRRGANTRPRGEESEKR